MADPATPAASRRRSPLLQGLVPLGGDGVATQVLAGVTLAALAIPEVMGYASIAGMPVVVDANVVTNLGSNTNQDEVYIVAANQSFLWEDASAPLFIRTDTGPSVKSLGVDLVVFGYSAFSHARYSGSAQRVTGSGLVNPYA